MSNIAKRMIGILITPKRAFTALRAETRHEDWWVPILVVTIVVFIQGSLLYPDALEKSVYDQLQYIENIDKENWPLHLHNARLTGLNAAYTTSTAGAIIIFLVAVIYWGIIRVIFRSKVTYKKVLAVASCSFLIQALEAVVTVPLAMEARLTRVQIRLGSLVPESLDGILFFDYLSLISVFDLWKYALMGFGLIVVSEIESKTAKYFLFILCLICALGAAGQEWGPSIRFK